MEYQGSGPIPVEVAFDPYSGTRYLIFNSRQAKFSVGDVQFVGKVESVDRRYEQTHITIADVREVK